MSGTGRLCVECGARAEWVVEPVGRYDQMGWADAPACVEHLGAVVTGYLGENMPRVQVRFWDVASTPEPSECCMEGCANLVADGDARCLNCERDTVGAIGNAS